jgi:hypothetical protein
VYIVAIESPFKPSADEIKKYDGRFSEAELLRQNLIYARLALKNSMNRGEAPFASHLLYTQVWDETPELRDAGIKAGLELYTRVDGIALYVDLGRSAGMRNAEKHADLYSVERSHRLILDQTSGADPRAYLATQELGGFTYLDELQGIERGSMGRIRTSKT